MNNINVEDADAGDRIIEAMRNGKNVMVYRDGKIAWIISELQGLIDTIYDRVS